MGRPYALNTSRRGAPRYGARLKEWKACLIRAAQSPAGRTKRKPLFVVSLLLTICVKMCRNIHTLLGVREKTQPPPGHTFRLVRWRNNQREVEVVLSPQNSQKAIGEGAHWHYHPALELTLYRSGHGTRFVGDHIEPFAAGDLVLLGENLPHYRDVRGPSSGVALQWEFPVEHPFWMFPETGAVATCFKEAERGIHYGGKAVARLTALLADLENSSGVGQLAVFFQILTTIATIPPSAKTFLSSQLFSLPNRSRHLSSIQAAIRYVVVNFREEISLIDVLKVSHMSKPTFARQFKKHSGKTLTQFIQQVRIAAACRELAATDTPITEVGLQNGFSDVSFFNRIFKRELGCAPSKYRATLQARPAGGGSTGAA
ncbi:MAG: AraC family transcriptional regulator [Opitutus sp.]|nr:AraC family transcriptional regulator [Opitutus sp.]